MERPVASIRELSTTDFVELLREDYASEKESTDDALREALRMYSFEGNLTEHEQAEAFEGPTRSETISPVHAREKNLEDVLAEIQRMVSSERCPEMLRIKVPRAVVPQLEALMRRTSARGDERKYLGTFVDKPGNHDMREDSAEQLIPEAAITAEEFRDGTDDDDPQEISGTPEAKAEARVEKDGDDAMGSRKPKNHAEQATDREACVDSGRRAESGMLQNGADRSVGADKEDREENRQEPKKKALEELNEDAVEERQAELGATIECSTSQQREENVFGHVDSGLLDDGVGELWAIPGRKREQIAKQGHFMVRISPRHAVA